MAQRPDMLETVEACYRVEQPTASWMRGVVESLRWLDVGAGLFGFTYAVDDAYRMHPGEVVEVGCSPEMRDAMYAATLADPALVRGAFLGVDCGFATDLSGFENSRQQAVSRELDMDKWGINGRNWDRHNAVVVIFHHGRDVDRSERLVHVSKKLAVHLAAGARLQRRLRLESQPSSVEAVLSPSGKVEHAVGEAHEPDALRALSMATLGREAARGRLRRIDGDAALARWKGRVAARWSLVDQFERDGKRYVLARENLSQLPPSPALTAREREVVSSAALGRTNKEIAYELGLAHSTVRVLLARAATKLGVRRRRELVEQFARLKRTD